MTAPDPSKESAFLRALPRGGLQSSELLREIPNRCLQCFLIHAVPVVREEELSSNQLPPRRELPRAFQAGEGSRLVPSDPQGRAQPEVHIPHQRIEIRCSAHLDESFSSPSLLQQESCGAESQRAVTRVVREPPV